MQFAFLLWLWNCEGKSPVDTPEEKDNQDGTATLAGRVYELQYTWNDFAYNYFYDTVGVSATIWLDSLQKSSDTLGNFCFTKIQRDYPIYSDPEIDFFSSFDKEITLKKDIGIIRYLDKPEGHSCRSLYKLNLISSETR